MPDIVVFGATGFTGKYAVAMLADEAQKNDLTWGVAGRSKQKLMQLLTNVTEKTGHDTSSVPIIIAEVDDEESLKNMCKQAKVLVNCCGPYRLYGEAVVRAAVETKTHYVDVSGEPQFIESMYLKYNSSARAAGVYVISACGLDSVPNDMGVIYMQQNFAGTLNSVESYLTVMVAPDYRGEAMNTGMIHYGTWDSLVRSIGNYDELRTLRKKIFPQSLPPFKPKLCTQGIHNRFGKWCVPFLGSDASIVYRTQRHLYESEQKRPVQFKPYVKIGNLFYLVVSLIAGVFLYIMSKFKFTTNLLLKYPRVFSFGMVTSDGPTEAVMNNTYYKFELFGEGWGRGDDESAPPTKKMAVKVSGMNPGYGGTVSALLYSAITILKEKDKMPVEGGVMTTGAAFAKTSLIDKLYDKNMKFEVISDEK